ADAGNRSQQGARSRVMPGGLPQQIGLQLLQEPVVMADHLKVSFHAQTRAVFFKTIEHVAVAGVLHHLFERIAVVLLIDQLHMLQELTAATHEKHPTSDQVTSGSHLTRVDVAQWESPATHESSDLLTVELVVLLLPEALRGRAVAAIKQRLQAMQDPRSGPPSGHIARNQIDHALSNVNQLDRVIAGLKIDRPKGPT